MVAGPGLVAGDAVELCPKKMVMGPCGGVRADGGCEVVLDRACVFDGSATWDAWAAPVAAIALDPVPLLLTDFSSEPYSIETHREVAAALAGTCDAVLVGDHQNRPDLPPTMFAALLMQAGVRPWITLACRDRNRVVLEQELTGLRELGVDAVMCVTGDARGHGIRPDVAQVFDLDGIRLTALAASLGLSAAVPETPTAPPQHRRGFRLVQKQKAGAAVAVLNHARVAEVAAFMADAIGAGLSIPVIAAVAVYTDARSAAVLDALPGLELDHGEVRQVLSQPDPVAAGIGAAVSQARQLLAIDGVVGVNLSGLGSERGYRFAAQVKADVARMIREEGAYGG